MAARIVGCEVVDHPTDPELIALARRYFLKFDRMTGSDEHALSDFLLAALIPVDGPA